MQKDTHFYLTYALARRAGIKDSEAKRIAWADQYVDDLLEAEIHGIQTQAKSSVTGNWSDPQIQLTVLSAFHFIPGEDKKHPWKTVRNSKRARLFVEAAIKASCPFRLGIALHGLQDTFSHENFSGWREDLNDCYPWYYLRSGLPNIGHAEMMATPDVANYVWTDPRTGDVIDNKLRTMEAAKRTHEFLQKFSGRGTAGWPEIKAGLAQLFALHSYDDRVTGLCKLSGNSKIDYDPVNKQLKRKATRSQFMKAASIQLSLALASFSDMEWK